MRGRNSSVRRGSVWWYEDSSEPRDGIVSGTRPVIVVSNNQRGLSPVVEVIKCTTEDKKTKCSKINIRLSSLPKQSYALCNQHTTIRIDDLGKFICNLTPDEMQRVDEGLRVSQGLMIGSYEVIPKVSEWTKDRAVQFLDDYRSMTSNEVMHKYGIKSIKALYSLKYRLSSKFGISDSNNDKSLKVVVDDGAFVPKRAYEYDAGMDLFTPIGFSINPECKFIIDTGVRVQIPRGYVGLIMSKSGLCTRDDIVSEGGVIDSGYTGTIKVQLRNHGSIKVMFSSGDKIAQLLVMPVMLGECAVVGELPKSDRGDNGFGSTGK